MLQLVVFDVERTDMDSDPLLWDLTAVTWGHFQDLSLGLLHSGAERLNDVLGDPLQSREVRHAEDVLTVRFVGDQLQFDFVRLFDPDGVQNDAPPPQLLGVGLHVILRLSVSDDHGDLRRPLPGPAPRCRHEVMLQHEVQPLAGVGPAPSVRQRPDVGPDVLFVLVGVEAELGAGSCAVLDQAHLNVIRTDVEAVDQRVQKATDLLEVF